MAKHDFGIMEIDPVKGKRYDTYNPEGYELVSISDELIENIIDKLVNIDFYWHSLDVVEKGIAYTGITLIPPQSALKFIELIKENKEFDELTNLLLKASKENKFVIHYGI